MGGWWGGGGAAFTTRRRRVGGSSAVSGPLPGPEWLPGAPFPTRPADFEGEPCQGSHNTWASRFPANKGHRPLHLGITSFAKIFSIIEPWFRKSKTFSMGYELASCHFILKRPNPRAGARSGQTGPPGWARLELVRLPPARPLTGLGPGPFGPRRGHPR
jgi:hypothetical protein